MAKVTLAALTTAPDIGSGSELRSVNLEIHDREFFVIHGPSGAGKSNMLRVIAGLDRAKSGQVQIGGKIVNNVSAALRDVAMVFSEESLYPNLTVYENIAFGLKRRKFEKSKIEKHARDAAEALAMTEFLDRKAFTLSLEQKQRVAVSRAIARQPKVLLLDEPFDFLGPDERSAFRIGLRQLHDRLQTTTIYATSDSSEAMALADRMAILQGGTLQQIGTPREILEQPANVAVGKFFGAPPMNFIRGMLRKKNDVVNFLEAGEGTINFPIEPWADAVIAAEDQPVFLGIRPRELEMVESDGAAPVRNREFFGAIIENVAPTSSGALLSLQTGAHTILCETGRSVERISEGRRTFLKLNIAKLRLFDALSGVSIF